MIFELYKKMKVSTFYCTSSTRCCSVQSGCTSVAVQGPQRKSFSPQVTSIIFNSRMLILTYSAVDIIPRSEQIKKFKNEHIHARYGHCIRRAQKQHWLGVCVAIIVILSFITNNRPIFPTIDPKKHKTHAIYIEHEYDIGINFIMFQDCTLSTGH